jgi:5-methylcytosine-specific restriction protein A
VAGCCTIWTMRSKRKPRRQSRRPSSAARGYDAVWQKVRKVHLRQFPDCVVCGDPGNEVDHIQSVRERPDLRLEAANLRTLCKRHHSRRTVMDQGFHKGKTIRQPAGEDGLPTDPKHPWNKT